MDWLKKALAIVRGVVAKVWPKVKAAWNFVFDPPPAAIGWYIVGALIVAVGGGFIGAHLKGAPSKHAAAPVYLMPRTPSVVTTTLPPPRSKELNALTLYKAKDVPGKTKTDKHKRKPKCAAMFC